MPEDAASIEHAWDTAAPRWRFEAHRLRDLLHSVVHRTQHTPARDTHRASALPLALRNLNASYARRIRDLDKARLQIVALRGDVDEAWKGAVEQVAELI
ncbi:hypothetical protein BGW80DRAFT_1462115 [Lactifluus volemus]|nr:hypothetical protein BGW80DRAFT_1462115 [Lactifluus volemus]